MFLFENPGPRFCAALETPVQKMQMAPQIFLRGTNLMTSRICLDRLRCNATVRVECERVIFSADVASYRAGKPAEIPHEATANGRVKSPY